MPSLGGSQLKLMTSAGGLVDASRFVGKDSILSGPAGGVIGFSRVAHRAGFQQSIGFDMGGTSTDVSRFDGTYEREFETQKAGVRIVAPMLAVETVAAGGGSICDFDGVKLVVGPASAGADPGPACYGRGGPLTVTDINLFSGSSRPSVSFSSRSAGGRSRAANRSASGSPTRRRGTAIRLRSSWPKVSSKLPTPTWSGRSAKSPSRRVTTRPITCLWRSAGPADSMPAPSRGHLGMQQILDPSACRRVERLRNWHWPTFADFANGPCCRPIRRKRWLRSNRLFDELEADARARSAGRRRRRGQCRAADSLARSALSRSRSDHQRHLLPPTEISPLGTRNCTSSFTVIAARAGRSKSSPPAWKSSAHCPSRTSRRSNRFAAALHRRRRPKPGSTGQPHPTPIFFREEIRPGDEFDGPAIVCEPTSTVVVDPGFRATVLAARRAADRTRRQLTGRLSYRPKPIPSARDLQ